MDDLLKPNAFPVKKKRPVNMRMIAAKAGVSATTVSLALRGDPSISPDTRERIYRLQEAMGYRQDRNRRAPAADSNHRIERVIYRLAGLDLRNETYAPFLHGIITECNRRSLKLELETTLDLSHGYAAVPAGRTFAFKKGLILSGEIGEEDIVAAENSGLPFVVLGNYRLGHPVNMVGIDLVEATERMVEDLHREGVRSVTLVVEEAKRPFEREMLRYLRGTLLDLDIPAGNDIIVETGAGFSEMHLAAAQVLERHKMGGRVITVEYRCADHLLMELRAQAGAAAGGIDLVSFAVGAPRHANRRYRVFDVGLEKCGEFAVSRLVDLLANSKAPACQCLLTAPGWTPAAAPPAEDS